MLSFIFDSLVKFWNIFLVLSPFFLLGLFLAGLLHVLVSKKQMVQVGGDPGMKGVVLASSLGFVLPLCSCGVAPVAVELKRKGASRQAIISFLITSPETAIDAILVTFGLLGPAIAIARPIAGYLLGIIGGFFAVGLLQDKEDVHRHHSEEKCDSDCDHSDLSLKNESDYVGFQGLLLSIIQLPRRLWYRLEHAKFLFSWYRPQESWPSSLTAPPPKASSKVLPLHEIGRRIFNYSYAHLADDVLPGLIMGLAITLAIFFVLPENLGEYSLMKKGLYPYLIMLLLGIPLYVCASASTPIAAALIFKGISPGAALVFLLTGPVTNLPTVVILMRHFGVRFVKIYLSCVMIGGLVAGVLFDFILHRLGIEIKAIMPTEKGVISFIEWISAFALIALIIWRFMRGQLREEFHEQSENVKAALSKVSGLEQKQRWYKHLFSWRSRVARYGLSLALVIYLATGLSIVPIGGVGYVRVFGHVVWKDLQPGLHYIPPQPIAMMDIWYPTYPQEVAFGLSSKQEFFSGDENIIDTQVTVQYIVKDPYRYFYQIGDPHALIADYLMKSSMQGIWKSELMFLLTSGRGDLEKNIEKDFIDFMNHPEGGDFSGAGIEIVAMNVVSLQPPQEVLFAFRDVMSAREDRETSNLKALSNLVDIVLRSRGDAIVEVERAKALAFSEEVEAKGKADDLLARAAVVAQHRNLLENLLWLETSERALSKPELYLLPPGNPPQKFKLWKSIEETVENVEMMKEGNANESHKGKARAK